MHGKRAADTVVTIAEVIRPNEANFLGKLFGGELLAKIDLCAYAASAKHSGTTCVTASFDQVDFHEPIEVGELVTLQGQVTFVGKTSMEVMVEVWTENLKHGVKRHARVDAGRFRQRIAQHLNRLTPRCGQGARQNRLRRDEIA